MMREIKFRAWNPSTKKIVPYEDFLLYDHGTEPVSFVMNLRGEPYNYQYMQYTGLLDKNGTEIYEGDIVEGDLGKYIIHKESDSNNLFAADIYDDGTPVLDDGLFLSNLKGYEVIGNIYENKGLLK